MTSAELSITPSEATQLFEEKVSRLRGEMGQAQRSAQEAVGQRDHALSEVTTLQREKDRLINELAQAKADKQRIMDSLAEHRKNVEASLTKQEQDANVVIEQSKSAEANVKELARQALQLRLQTDGIKRTLSGVADELAKGVTAAVTKLQAALAGIPDAPKS